MRTKIKNKHFQAVLSLKVYLFNANIENNSMIFNFIQFCIMNLCGIMTCVNWLACTMQNKLKVFLAWDAPYLCIWMNIIEIFLTRHKIRINQPVNHTWSEPWISCVCVSHLQVRIELFKEVAENKSGQSNSLGKHFLCVMQILIITTNSWQALIPALDVMCFPIAKIHSSTERYRVFRCLLLNISNLVVIDTRIHRVIHAWYVIYPVLSEIFIKS